MPPTHIRGLLPRRPTPTPAPTCLSQRTPQSRHATFIARPRRPFHFTQLVQLSDGSTYTQRTTSPLPVYRSLRDTRNHILWQPSEKMLQNIEHDEAGRLAAFRSRFGHSFDFAKTKAEKEALKEHERRLRMEAKLREGKSSEEATAEIVAETADAAKEEVALAASAASADSANSMFDDFDMLGDLIKEYADPDEISRLKGQSKEAWKDAKAKKK